MFLLHILHLVARLYWRVRYGIATRVSWTLGRAWEGARQKELNRCCAAGWTLGDDGIWRPKPLDY